MTTWLCTFQNDYLIMYFSEWLLDYVLFRMTTWLCTFQNDYLIMYFSEWPLDYVLFRMTTWLCTFQNDCLITNLFIMTICHYFIFYNDYLIISTWPFLAARCKQVVFPSFISLGVSRRREAHKLLLNNKSTTWNIKKYNICPKKYETDRLMYKYSG